MSQGVPRVCGCSLGVRRAAMLIVPQINATLSDGPPGIRTTSAVERAIKKHPHLARFERNDAPLQRVGLPNIRRLTNGDGEEPFRWRTFSLWRTACRGRCPSKR